MFQNLVRLLLCLPILLIDGSSGTPRQIEIIGGTLQITAEALVAPQLEVRSPLSFVKGWELRSLHKSFGGISAMAKTRGGFLALSDIGAFFHFQMDNRGLISLAQIIPVPSGCLKDKTISSRDTESLTQDRVTGNTWIGFESLNGFCRISADGQGARFYQPPDIRKWRSVRGPESLVRLNDGRFLTIAEEPADGSALSPAIIFDRDPIDPNARRIHFQYRPPEGYRPTDAVQLRDGRLLVLNRRVALPYGFASKISVVDIPKAAGIMQGQVLAALKGPGLHDNFEALALSYSGGRTFLWMMSDDNYLPFQHNYLLLFEIKAEEKPSASIR
jgi:hypothetical protein